MEISTQQHACLSILQRNIGFDLGELPKISLFTSSFFTVYELNQCVGFYNAIFVRNRASRAEFLGRLRTRRAAF